MPDEAAGEEPGQADEVPWGVSVLDAFTVFPEAFSSHPSCPLLLLGAQDCGTFLIVLRFLFMHVSSGTSCFGGDLLSKSERRAASWGAGADHLVSGGLYGRRRLD